MTLRGLDRGVSTALRVCGRALPLLLLLPALRGEAAENPLVSGQLLVQGTRLTLYTDDLTTDADQTLDIGERARVRTCFGGIDAPCGTILPGDPRIAGLTVHAELIGPEAPAGIPLGVVKRNSPREGCSSRFHVTGTLISRNHLDLEIEAVPTTRRTL